MGPEVFPSPVPSLRSGCTVASILAIALGACARAPRIETESGPSPVGPVIEALARQAAACPRPSGWLVRYCPELEAWHERKQLFRSAAANDTMLRLLEGPDPAVREAVALKGFFEPDTYFAEPTRARRLMAVAIAERDGAVVGALGELVGRFDVEAAGQAEGLRQLARHPSRVLRERLPRALDRYPTPIVIVVTRHLLDDAERDVRHAAIGALERHGAGKTPQPAVCRILAERLARTDDVAGAALHAAAISSCTGLDERVLAVLEGWAGTPRDLDAGARGTLTSSRLCEVGEPAFRQRALAALTALARPAENGVETRVAAVRSLGGCEVDDAWPLVDELTRDRSLEVAEAARFARRQLLDRANHERNRHGTPDDRPGE